MDALTDDGADSRDGISSNVERTCGKSVTLSV